MRVLHIRCVVAAMLAAGALPCGAAHARAAAGGVFYHDQSGDARSGLDAAQAARLASRQLGFTVRLPASWPRGSSLRALWVMNQRAPRFVVLYYGGDDGYITCQLHESLGVTSVALSWAPRRPVTIAHVQGTLLRSSIGGANPVVELIWRDHGVRIDLLGSTTTTLHTIMRMAASLT